MKIFVNFVVNFLLRKKVSEVSVVAGLLLMVGAVAVGTVHCGR